MKSSLIFKYVGSTVVPILAAKPIIDLFVCRRSGKNATAPIAVLVLGYEYLGEAGVPGRLVFSVNVIILMRSMLT